jgi:cell division inhibitor SulA/protein ImuA
MGHAQPAPSALDALLARPDIRRGGAVGAVAHPGIPSGFAALDAVLPGGGWPTGALTELLPRHEGIGELRLLGAALASIAAQGRGLAWIAPPHLPYAPALAAAGIDLARVLVVKTRSPQETLWATEQALASNACGAVLAWPRAIRYTALRRLQVAAEGGHALAFVFRPPAAAHESSPAVLRLALETHAGGLAVHVLKRRGPALPQPVVLHAFAVPARMTHAHALDRASSAAAAGRAAHSRLAVA